MHQRARYLEPLEKVCDEVLPTRGMHAYELSVESVPLPAEASYRFLGNLIRPAFVGENNSGSVVRVEKSDNGILEAK